MATKKKAKTAKKAKPVVKKKLAKKKTAKKTLKKTAAAPAAAYLKLQVAGEITHFFPHVSAGVVKLSSDLSAGDMIQIKGHTTDFKQSVGSMQINHVPVTEAKKGDEIGIKVKDRVRIGDVVYKL